VEVGQVLMEIRDDRLYKETHSSFKDYCKDRWGLAGSTAYYYINSYKVMENVHNCGQLPANESQARPLAKLPPEEQNAV